MPSYVLSKKRTNFGCFKSISQALEKLRNDINLFIDLFGFEPAEVYTMALNLLPPVLEVPRRGKFHREECLLVLLSRMKQAISTLTFQGFLFERDPYTLCDIFSHTAEIIEKDFKELLNPANLFQFRASSERFRQVMLRKFQEKMKDPNAKLPSRFEGVNCVMAGSRFVVAKPVDPMRFRRRSKVPRTFSSGRDNLNVLIVTLPNGIIACSKFDPGRPTHLQHVDPIFESQLTNAKLMPLCDGIFGYSPNIKPIMSSSLQGVESKTKEALSTLRIDASRNFLGIKQMYPILQDPNKTKLFQNRPTIILNLALLFANFKCCFRGEIATSYFYCETPRFEEYISFKSMLEE